MWERKDGIKFVIIPKKSEIVKGDYVKIIKMEGENDRRREEEKEAEI